jgi:predicted transposase/invertase (TIGR01784 family)
LGSIGNENLLIDFINGIINPPSPIASVTFINPVNEKQHTKDKYSVVDIKALDENGIKYQIEVQLTEPAFLPNRMLYTWSSIYHTQAVKGEDYSTLKPVISIWLLTGDLLKDDKYHHKFTVYDKQNDIPLTDHCSIHVLELTKWHKPERLQPEDNWLYFFKEGKNWKELPPALKTIPVMRQAMKTLESIASSEDSYLAYMSRQDQIMLEKSMQAEARAAKEQVKEMEKQRREIEEQRKAAEEQRKAAEEQRKAAEEQRIAAEEQRIAAEAERDASEAKVKQLLELLKQSGIEPDLDKFSK